MREKIREKGKAEAPKTLKMPVFSRVLDLKLDKSKFEGKGNVSGDRVRELRLRARLSQTALAAKMQTEGAIIEQDAVSRIESGSRLVTDYELLVLTRIFHVSADWLIGADKNPPRD